MAADQTLVLIADTHIQPELDDRLDGEDTFANLKAVLARIAASRIRPDGFIFAGDTTRAKRFAMTCSNARHRQNCTTTSSPSVRYAS
ncbi:MAG: hypothetical protein EBT47_05525 [Chloroflexi bacterium]|nr:hypothetical protein [Chloroflexota bacterium]